MEKQLFIETDQYRIPAVFCYPDGKQNVPAVVLCHGSGSQKNEVGDMFVSLAESLMEQGIASIRFDFAGCGESEAAQQELTFFGEVRDARRAYEYLLHCGAVDPENIGILGFSQGARVMAELLKDVPEMKCAVSWSGACHNGRGVFEGWFQEYYQEAVQNGYARMPMEWRSDLLLSKKWFDEIENSTPMDGWKQYKGPVLAVAGTKDELVPCQHAAEILDSCEEENEKSEMLMVPGVDHVFDVLTEDRSKADLVINRTVEWVCEVLKKGDNERG